jgi:hypothetical protein
LTFRYISSYPLANIEFQFWTVACEPILAKIIGRILEVFPLGARRSHIFVPFLLARKNVTGLYIVSDAGLESFEICYVHALADLNRE